MKQKKFWKCDHINRGDLLLNNTFVHVPGIGQKTEERFWAAGIRCWDDFVEPLPIRLPAATKKLIHTHVDRSRTCLVGQPDFFTDLLPASQHWRIFPHFRQTTVYLDIETTGLDGYANEITTIALYDGHSVFHYVNGENLDDFGIDIGRFDVIVTYNGKCFDIPFIENCLGIRLNQAHIDLRYVLKGLGYSGGLKGCERQLGLDRGQLAGVDGYFAVLLWAEYRNAGNRRALETLLAYNIQDVVNLEILMVEAYNLNIKRTPFFQSHKLPSPLVPPIPFAVDRQIIDAIKRTYRF